MMSDAGYRGLTLMRLQMVPCVVKGNAEMYILGGPVGVANVKFFEITPEATSSHLP